MTGMTSVRVLTSEETGVTGTIKTGTLAETGIQITLFLHFNVVLVRVEMILATTT